MGTTSGCCVLLFVALTHLRAELSRISLRQACILLLYFLTLLCTSALSVPSPNTDVYMEWHWDTCVHAYTTHKCVCLDTNTFEYVTVCTYSSYNQDMFVYWLVKSSTCPICCNHIHFKLYVAFYRLHKH